MAKIQCSQCAYFNNSCTGDCSCSRYSIKVDKNTTCVDNEEIDE